MKFLTSLAFTDPRDFLVLARTAEACGWDGLALSDHVFFPEHLASRYPYAADGKPYWDPSAPWPDPWVAVGAMAAVTSRLRFLTNVYVLPARNPLLVAKAVATAAVLARGRVALGIGVGWMREEFDLLGQEFANRGRRTDEAIEVLRTVWRGGMVKYRGKFYAFDRIQMSPAPPRPIPIYVGGISEPALRRAARYGDGWISVLQPFDEIRNTGARLNGLRAEFARAEEPFEIVASCSDLTGLDGYRQLAEAGVTSTVTVPWALYGADPESLAAKQRALERFAEEVIEPMREAGGE